MAERKDHSGKGDDAPSPESVRNIPDPIPSASMPNNPVPIVVEPIADKSLEASFTEPLARGGRRAESFNPAEWKIARTFRSGERTFAIGEPVPVTLSMEQMEEQIKQGNIIPLGGDKNSWRKIVKGRRISEISDYLRGNDVQVIRAIRENQPGREELQNLLDQARRGRSRMLVEVLELLNDVPLER